MTEIPPIFWSAVIFIFGLVIGSFLNVVIYRLHTDKSLNDRSHCLSCGHTLSWYELVPVFSYLFLRGRCSYCQAFIPVRYLLVELATGLAFLLAWSHTKEWFSLLLLSAILSALIIGAVYDLYHMIIPDEVVIVVASLATILVGYQALSQSESGLVIDSIAAGGMTSFVFAALWWVSKGKWIGFGDAKLAFGLGMLTGLSGVFSLIVLSFWVGAATALGLMMIQNVFVWLHSRRGSVLRSRVRMKSEVPFAPFMIVAFLLVYFGGADILSWTSYAIEFFFNLA